MTAVLQEAHTESVTEEVEANAVASWWSRAGAFAVDVLFPFGVIAALALAAWLLHSGPPWQRVAISVAAFFSSERTESVPGT